MPRSKSILVRENVVGFHCWPTPDPAVPYLGQTHRHRFGFIIEASVTHGDREVEFHMLQRSTRAVVGGLFPMNEHGEYEFGARSCEAIAEAVLLELEILLELETDGLPILSVEVWEDGECGARVKST